MNFIYRLNHDCARTLKRSLSRKLAIVELSGEFGFARNSSKYPCTLTSFSRARMPRSVCTHDVTCELYCMYIYSVKPLQIDYLLLVSCLYGSFTQVKNLIISVKTNII